MNDLRTLVAMRIAESDGYLRKQEWGWDRLSPKLQEQYLRNADAAITVIFDWLIHEAPENSTVRVGGEYWSDLDDWISCRRQGTEYRGFEDGEVEQ